ncbi:hypothetical protein [Novosphingobium album (ex Liu et al. 2023)]|uniref:VCBS repeat-containing protein n=1 Tax=Novosphingobium album (ex Liu et al. 2023) TaxID=3031130 RepID=A0ABT5WS11_9SPHN|nr:hypothetical protein [Novosphingobium album (ex Liu et al. 2023)]MDE8652836.1 hypothetical protein [Novosphingobium album (ex Liu et al. 2023)]
MRILPISVGTLAAALLGSPLVAQTRSPIPAVVLTHMHSLDTRCKAAGGREGTRRYVIAQDFNGDGLLDYLLSEGDYECIGRPVLFRQNGQARVDIFVTDRANNARRVYSDTLVGYRVLAGAPPKVQIARKGGLCGAGSSPTTQCAAQLAWNGQGFGEAVSVNNAKPGAMVPPGTPGPSSLPNPSPSQGSEVVWKVKCRSDLVRRDASAARWADDECKTRWEHVVASSPAADFLMSTLPAASGARVTLDELKRHAPSVRWAARPTAPTIANGRLGNLDVAVAGPGQPGSVSLGWSEVGAEIPHDIVEAMRLKGASLTQRSCEKTGAGAGTRTFAGNAPGRAPFTMVVEQQTAPLGHMQSYYTVEVRLDGRTPPQGPTSGCDF